MIAPLTKEKRTSSTHIVHLFYSLLELFLTQHTISICVDGIEYFHWINCFVFTFRCEAFGIQFNCGHPAGHGLLAACAGGCQGSSGEGRGKHSRCSIECLLFYGRIMVEMAHSCKCNEILQCCTFECKQQANSCAEQFSTGVR